jgi:geranylgeranyl diphosphate synthase type II
MPGGITAGQAWESEPEVDVDAYHRAKTGALFTAATTAGAVAAGADPGPWRELGAKLGEAYQVADDLADALSSEAETGKPKGQDAAHARPNAVAALGVSGAVARLQGLIEAAAGSIPPCQGAGALRDLVVLQAKRLAPKNLDRSVA